MKIVHLLSSFGAGGAELLVKDIAINSVSEKSIMPDLKVEVWAVGETHDKEFEEKYINELAQYNIPCIKIGKIAGKNKVKVLKNLRKSLKERKPDIVNAHSELVTFYVSAAAIGLGTIIVQTVHNTVITHPVLEKYFAGLFVKKFVAISQKCKNLIKKNITGNEKRIKLIYNGINIQKFQQQERIINREVKNIMSIGRLDVQKDHHTLLRSFAILKDMLGSAALPVPQLNIIGSGVLFNDLKKLSQDLNIQEYTNFMGVRNDVPSILYLNDIWVMSSRWEGFSIALMEALASGIPIVATDVGSNDELIENGVNGILTEKESPKQLAEEMFSVIRDYTLRGTISRNARERIVNFHIKKCTQSYLELYRELMKKEYHKVSANEAKPEISKAI